MLLVKNSKNFRDSYLSKKILIIVKVMQLQATYMLFLTLVPLVKMFIKLELLVV